MVFRLVALFMVEHLVIALNPDSLERKSTEKVPCFNHFGKFLRNPSPNQSLFPMKTIIVVGSDPTGLMHDECGPSPCPCGLDAIPYVMFDQSTYPNRILSTIMANHRPGFPPHDPRLQFRILLGPYNFICRNSTQSCSFGNHLENLMLKVNFKAPIVRSNGL